jgi:two-component system, NtrC family, response regulator AtoC
VSDATTVDAGEAAHDPQAGTRGYLVVREGARTQVILLDEGADLLFGRSSDATVRIDDVKASREHARIVKKDGVVELVELGSRNGTRLNDDTVRGETRRLRSGDLVRIGEAEILVAESAGIASRAAGGRLAGELARVLQASRRAALVRVSLDSADLARLSPQLGALALVEEQADGDYAFLLEDATTEIALVATIRRLAPAAVVSVARAPEDGTTADELWRRAEPAGDARPSPAPTPAPATAPPGVVIADAAMVRVFDLVRKVAPTPTTVLILGETGVGKEVIAEQIHRQSPRASGPFVRLNCGSLPETLLESELFGHERGAFTGADRRKIGYIEAASGGTLFLDEIGELALPMQTRLLRVLENHKFTRVGGREEIASDLRIVAATNRNLEAEAKTGKFREDLFFRLSAFVVQVPPLRERTAEDELLAQLFARQFAKRMNVPPPTIAPAALTRLKQHAWPGNVRELRNAMERAVVLAENGVLAAEHLPDSVRESHAPVGPMREQLAEMERRAIEDALEAEDGNQTRAAKRLGISRRALQYKLGKYDL